MSTRLDELAVLVDVAEMGSLTAAAKKRGVPKSTVGRAIRRLEEDLGLSLVRRMTRDPEGALTDAGRHLASLSAPHVAALRDAPAALGRISSEAYGLLRVSTLSDVASQLITPLLPGFLARYPRIRPELVLGLRMVDLVREGFDVAVRVTLSATLKSSALLARKLGPMNISLYASTQYAARRELPKHPEDLLNHDHVVFFPGGANEYAMRDPKGTVTKLRISGARASGDDFFFVREAIIAGLGIGPLPWFMASQEVAAGRIARVLPGYQAFGGAIYVVYPPAKPLPPKVAAFTSYLVEHAPRLLGQS